ncbi:hypothetical protein K438DRAFT_1961951 [Mycena galopus ATCC 62051]|nr:hypothetical protein K438DRAFT_1961951 [Mycena galopus ATCC 62051]
MRFFSASVLAFFAAAVGSASAATIVDINKRCSLSECIISLAAEGVSCAAALAEAGVDPIADIACILDAGAASLVVVCHSPSLFLLLERSHSLIAAVSISGSIVTVVVLWDQILTRRGHVMSQQKA